MTGILTPFHPPLFDSLATRTLSNSQCRAAVLDLYAVLQARVAEGQAEHEAQGEEFCDSCLWWAASLARLRALITGEGIIIETWQRAPRERVTV